MIGYLDKDNKSILLISKMSGCVKTFKVEEGDKEKKKINIFSYIWWKTVRKI